MEAEPVPLLANFGVSSEQKPAISQVGIIWVLSQSVAVFWSLSRETEVLHNEITPQQYVFPW